MLTSTLQLLSINLGQYWMNFLLSVSQLSGEIDMATEAQIDLTAFNN